MISSFRTRFQFIINPRFYQLNINTHLSQGEARSRISSEAFPRTQSVPFPKRKKPVASATGF